MRTKQCFRGEVRSILRTGPLRYANLAHPVTDILPHPLGVGTPPTNGRRLGATNRLFFGFLLRKVLILFSGCRRTLRGRLNPLRLSSSFPPCAGNGTIPCPFR